MTPPASFARVYYDHTSPFSYRGVKALSKGVNATEREALEWLQTQNNYTLFRPARKKLNKDSIVVSGIDSQWSADLIEMIDVAKQNKGFKYILTIVDTLSKFAWVVPLKDKRGETTAAAFTRVFKQGRTPRNIRTDSGSEFQNKTVASVFKKYSVNHFIARNQPKAAIVERFNRTLKNKMFKYFHATNQKNYIDILPDLVAAYNSSYHTTVKTTPDSITPYNAETVWQRLYGHLLKKKKKKKKTKFKLGDLVRISKQKNTFEKGYKEGWVDELFTIAHVNPGRVGRERYKVKDFNDELIVGSFKPEELQKVKRGKPREIKKTVKTTKTQKAVTWRGYPDSLVTWIDRN